MAAGGVFCLAVWRGGRYACRAHSASTWEKAAVALAAVSTTSAKNSTLELAQPAMTCSWYSSASSSACSCSSEGREGRSEGVARRQARAANGRGARQPNACRYLAHAVPVPSRPHLAAALRHGHQLAVVAGDPGGRVLVGVAAVGGKLRGEGRQRGVQCILGHVLRAAWRQWRRGLGAGAQRERLRRYRRPPARPLLAPVRTCPSCSHCGPSQKGSASVAE